MSIFFILPAALTWRQRDMMSESLSPEDDPVVRLVPGGKAVLIGTGLLALGVILNQAIVHIGQISNLLGQ